MKKRISLFLLLTFSLFLLVGCGGTEKPTKVVENYFSDIEKGSNSEIVKSLMKTGIALSSEKDISPEATEAILGMFSKLNCEVTKETINGDSATVNVKVKGVSLKTVIATYIPQMVGMAISSGGKLSEEEMNKKAEDALIQVINSAVVEDRDCTVNLTLKDKKWVVTEDDALMEALLGITKEDISKLKEMN